MTTEVRINTASHNVLVHQQDWNGDDKKWGEPSTFLIEKGVVDTRYVHNERRILIEEVEVDRNQLTFEFQNDEVDVKSATVAKKGK